MTGRRPNTTKVWNFFNSFREADIDSCRTENLIKFSGPVLQNWTVENPEQSGGVGQCCSSCTGVAKCKGWVYSGKTCTLLAEVTAKAACDAKATTCVSGVKGYFPTWTTLPQAFKKAGYLTLGTVRKVY